MILANSVDFKEEFDTVEHSKTTDEEIFAMSLQFQDILYLPGMLENHKMTKIILKR